MEQATDKGKNSQRHIEAKKYLDDNDIEMVISEMLNSLLHEKDKHPYVYMIKYLAGLMSEDERKEFNLSIPEPYPTGRPVVKYPKFDPSTESLLKQYLDKDEWNSLRYVKTKYGNNINSITRLGENRPSDKIGCVLTDGDCLNVYSSVLNKIISDVHKIQVDYNAMKEYQLNTFTQLKQSDLSLISKLLLDKIDKVVLSFSRNIAEYPFNHFSSGTNRLAAVESLLIKSISGLKADNFIPDYKVLSLIENKEECDQILSYINYDLEWLTDAGLKQSWPDCRKIIGTEDKSLIILLNFSDHLQIFNCSEKGSIDIPQMYNTTIEILKQMSLVINFESSKHLGFITSDINLLGSGFKISSWITFNELASKTLPNNINIQDLLKGLHFDSFKGFNEAGDNENNNKLFSSQSNKLCFKNNMEFLLNYLSKLCGLSRLDSDSNLAKELSFEYLSLPSDDKNVKQVYDEYFEEMKYQLSSQGNNINSLFNYYSVNPSNHLGIIIHDSSEYYSFCPLIEKYILLSQSFDSKTTDHIHKPDEPKQMTEIKDDNLSKISNVSICLMRNIEGYSFPHVKTNSNAEIEELIQKTITTINTKGYFADYFSLNFDETKEQAMKLINEKKLTICHDDKMAECRMDNDYPTNRGVIQFSRDNLYAVVNDMDHIKFSLLIEQPKEKFGSALVSLLKVVNEFSKHIIFSYDMKLGFLTTSPKYLGTGLDIKLIFKLTKLTKEDLQKHLEDKDNKQFNAVVVSSDEDGSYQVQISNKVTIGMSETELLINLLQFLNDLIELDT